MKKMFTALAALVMVLFLASPASASATTSKTSADTAVTMTATVTKMAGNRGFTDIHLSFDCKEYYYGIPPIAGWDNPAVDGHGFTVKDGDGNLLWSETDAESNVYVADGGGTCRVTLALGSFPDAHIIKFNWPFTEQLNHQHDFDDNLHIEFTNYAN